VAIFHMTAKVISRGKGQSAIAAAAYRSGERLKDREADEIKHYTARAERIVTAGIMRPSDTPELFQNREELWNAVEGFEKRRDAQLAREIEIALPHELTDQQREYLVKDFAREQFVRRGYIVDYAIHGPEADSDKRNHHAHMMITMRTCDREGFAAKKDRSLNNIDQLATWREKWAELANRHLERHGHDARIDHRSLEAQGIEREPQIHVGVAAQAMSERGKTFESVAAKVNNAYSPEQRTVDYPGIDAGRSRAEHNAGIIERNAERERDETGRLIRDRWTKRGGMEPQQTAAAHAAAREKEAAANRHVHKEREAKQEQQGTQGRAGDTPEPTARTGEKAPQTPREAPREAAQQAWQQAPQQPPLEPSVQQLRAALDADTAAVSDTTARQRLRAALDPPPRERTDSKQDTQQREKSEAQQLREALNAQLESYDQQLMERGYSRDTSRGKGGGRER
jgi:hypothetical protein